MEASSEARLRALKRINVAKLFFEIVRLNASLLKQLDLLPHRGFATAGVGNAANGGIPLAMGRRKADVIITSPPYLGAQKYIRATSQSLTWLGLCRPEELAALEQDSIGREHFPKRAYVLAEDEPVVREARNVIAAARRLNPLRAHIACQYLAEMRAALRASTGVLKRDGHLVLIVGENQLCGGRFDTPLYLRQLAEAEGLTMILHLKDRIRSRGLLTARHETGGLIADEHILILRKI